MGILTPPVHLTPDASDSEANALVSSRFTLTEQYAGDLLADAMALLSQLGSLTYPIDLSLIHI